MTSQLGYRLWDVGFADRQSPEPCQAPEEQVQRRWGIRAGVYKSTCWVTIISTGKMMIHRCEYHEILVYTGHSTSLHVCGPPARSSISTSCSSQQYWGRKTCAECQKEYRSKSEERHRRECKGKKAGCLWTERKRCSHGRKQGNQHTNNHPFRWPVSNPLRYVIVRAGAAENGIRQAHKCIFSLEIGDPLQPNHGIWWSTEV